MATNGLDENEWLHFLNALEEESEIDGERGRSRGWAPSGGRSGQKPRLPPYRWPRRPVWVSPPVRVFPPLVPLPFPYPPAQPGAPGGNDGGGSAPNTTCSCQHGSDPAAEPPTADQADDPSGGE